MLTEIPQRLNARYAFLGICGAGGTGTVVKVHDRITDKTVALKILENISGDARALFISEFKTLSRLHHPSLIDVYDFGVLPSGDLFFTMEYFEGTPINHSGEITSHDDRLALFSSTAFNLLDALGYVHAAGTIHGDLKPSNILVAGESLRILDFGLSGFLKRGDGISGTLEYMAPEIVRGEQATLQSDLYALGALWFELLTGEPPFTGTPDAIIRSQLRDLAPEVSSRNAAVPHDVDAILARMLAKEPHRRWQHCEQISKALNNALDKKSARVHRVQNIHGWVPGSLIGRDAALHALGVARASVVNASRAVRITGMHGAGASRLIREFAVERMLNGDTVAQLACTDRTTVRDCFLAATGNAEFAGESIDALTTQTADAIARATANGTMILVIDDFENAEHSVRTFITELIARAQEYASALFVCVDRSTPREENIFSENISLAPLDAHALEIILHERFSDAAFVPELAARLAAISGGIIGMMLTTVHALEHSGAILFDQGSWRCTTPIASISMPEDLGASLRKTYGLDVLMAEPVTGDILRAIAFSKEYLPEELLELIVQTPASGVRQAIAGLVATGVLDRIGVEGTDQNYYAFGSVPLRDAAALRAEGQRTKNIHRALARVLREHGSPPTIFADHLFLAGDFDEAIPALESSGDLLRAQFAARRAAAEYSDAVVAARRAHQPAAIVGGLLLKVAAAAGMDGDRTAEGDAVQEAIVAASNAGDPKFSARALLREAEYLTAVGDLARAEHSAERGRAAAHDAHDAALEAQCQAARAVTFQRRGEAQLFLEHARTAMQMFRDAAMPEDAASIQLDIGFTHALFLNQPDRALQEFEEAKNDFERARSQRGVARAVGSIGLAQYMLGRYEDSLRSLESAHAQFETLGDMRGQASALANSARSLLVLRRYPQAVARASAAIALAKKIRDRFAEQRSLETLAAAFDRLGQYERAREALTRGYAFAQEIGNRAGEASSLQMIGTVQLHRGQFDQAKRSLEQSRAIADALNETDAQVIVRLYLAEVALRQSQPDAEAAAKNILEAEKFISAGGRHGSDSAVMQLHAELALLENNLVDARRYAAEALRAVADHPESYEEPHSVWLTHFKVYERSGDYATAKQSLDRAYALLLTAADAITDAEFRRSFLEEVAEHTAIVDAYRRMKAPPLNIMPAANELMLRRLYDISRALNSVLDLNEVLNRLVDNALEVLHAERGLIFLFDEKEGKLVLSIARNVDAATIEDATKISEGILNDVFQRGKPVVTLNAGVDPRFRERQSVVNFQLATVFCVPLMLRDRTIGSLYVDSRRAPSGQDESATTVEFLEAFANLAAVAIDNARLHEQMRDENKYLRREVEERYAFENIIGSSPAMKRVYELMRGALRGDSPVLIEGASGTGKELVARAIHFNGKRKQKKFVAIDCGALPETLLDSELFGHKKGAFTGAIDDKMGLYEEADGGTIFLDEITNTSLAFQAKLLRVVQEGEIRRIGDTATRKVDVRIIAATNKNLQEEIREQRFREDLYYRLNVIPIRLPSLHERTEDIPFLVDFFVKRYVEKLQSTVRGVSGELMNVMVNAPWHGNVRELENTIHRILIYANGETLSTKDLPPDFQYLPRATSPTMPRISVGRSATLDEMQQHHIAAVLKSTDGNKTEAAKILGIKRTTLIERMKRLKMM